MNVCNIYIHSPLGMESMPTQNVWYPRSHLSQNIISSSWWGCWHTVQVLHSMHCQWYVWITLTSSMLMSKQDGWPEDDRRGDTCTEANVQEPSQRHTNMQGHKEIHTHTKTQKQTQCEQAYTHTCEYIILFPKALTGEHLKPVCVVNKNKILKLFSHI